MASSLAETLHQHPCSNCGDWVYCGNVDESAEQCKEQLLCPRCDKEEVRNV